MYLQLMITKIDQIVFKIIEVIMFTNLQVLIKKVLSHTFSQIVISKSQHNGMLLTKKNI